MLYKKGLILRTGWRPAKQEQANPFFVCSAKLATNGTSRLLTERVPFPGFNVYSSRKRKENLLAEHEISFLHFKTSVIRHSILNTGCQLGSVTSTLLALDLPWKARSHFFVVLAFRRKTEKLGQSRFKPWGNCWRVRNFKSFLFHAVNLCPFPGWTILQILAEWIFAKNWAGYKFAEIAAKMKLFQYFELLSRTFYFDLK